MTPLDSKAKAQTAPGPHMKNSLSNKFCASCAFCQSKGQIKCLGILISHHSSAAHAASQHCWCAQGKSSSLRRYKHCARLGMAGAAGQSHSSSREPHALPPSLEVSVALSVSSHLSASPGCEGRLLQQQEAAPYPAKSCPKADPALCWLLLWSRVARAQPLAWEECQMQALPSQAGTLRVSTRLCRSTRCSPCSPPPAPGMEVTAAAGASWQIPISIHLHGRVSGTVGKLLLAQRVSEVAPRVTTSNGESVWCPRLPLAHP